MTNANLKAGFFLNHFHIKPEFDSIELNEQVLKIEPKVMEVLVYLADHQGHVISTETLIEEVWPDTVVSPQSVHRCISKLRKIFALDTEHSGYIKTYPKKGYSLEFAPATTPVASQSDESNSASPPKAPANMPWLIAGIAALALVIAGFAAWQIVSETPSEPEPVIVKKLPGSDYALTGETKHKYQSIAAHPSKPWLAAIRQKESSYELLVDRQGRTQVLEQFDAKYARYKLTWSSEGSSLLLSRWIKDNSHIISYEIDVASGALKERKELATIADYRVDSLAWADSNTAYLAQTHISRFEFYLRKLNLKTGKLSETPYKEKAHLVAYKDGLLAVAARDYRQTHLLVMDSSFDIKHHFTTRYVVSSIDWLSDGSGLVYSSGSNLMKWLFERKRSQRLFNSQGHVESVSVAANNELLYLDVMNNLDIRQHKVGEQGNTPKVHGPGPDRKGKFANHSDRFAYISKINGIEQVYLLDESGTKAITEFTNRAQIDSIHWSVDDAWLLIQRGQEILLHSFAIGSSNVVLSNNLFMEAIGLTDDHQHLYYRDGNTSPISFWRYSTLDGAEERLKIPASSQTIAANGELCYRKKRDTSLFCTKGDLPRLVTNDLPHQAVFISSNTDKAYYYLDRANEMKNIYELDLTSGKHQLIIARGDYQGDVSSVRGAHYLATYNEPLSRQIKAVAL